MLTSSLRWRIRVVALANIAYFGVEFLVARRIGSVSLFADSIDFLEDASVNGLILMAYGWSASRRAAVGKALAGILLVPGIATLWTAAHKFGSLVPPSPGLLSLEGLAALVISLSCALLLAPYRAHGGSLTRAAFLSARNDALANVAILVAAGLTLSTASAWPDLAVGLGIAAINADAAREVYAAARDEHLASARP